MDPNSFGDMSESWIEVTPQSLGYQSSTGVRTSQTVLPTLEEFGGLHPVVSAQLLERLLTEAQDNSDRASMFASNEATPPSPPPSRELDHSAGQFFEPVRVVTPDTLMAAALAKATTNISSKPSFGVASGSASATFIPEGEWASRPEVGGYPLLAAQLGSPDVSQLVGSQHLAVEPSIGWRLRHSWIMKSRLIGWLLDLLPRVIGHAATFLLGAATMFVLMRKRVKTLPPVSLPLD